VLNKKLHSIERAAGCRPMQSADSLEWFDDANNTRPA
jgi:hypothetical protein